MRVSSMKTGAVLALGLSLPMAAGAESHNNAEVGAKGYVAETASARPVTSQCYYGQKYNEYGQRHKRPVEVFASPNCPANFTGMFRGTLYCVNGKLLR